MRRSPRTAASFLPHSLALSLVAGGCTDSAGAAGKVEVSDSAGVTVVRNLSPALALEVTSEPVLSLGGKETREESFYRVGSWNVGADRDGNVFVLDRESYEVQVFDSAGRHLRTMGGKGEGPGELQWPFALTASADGRVRIMDVGKHAFVQWGPTGEVEEADRVPQGYFGGEVAWTPAGTVLPLQDPATGGDRLALVPPGGEHVVLASLPAGERKAITLESCGMSFSGMSPVFAPSLVWAAAGNTVVVARNPEYVLDVYEDGRLTRSVRLDVAPRPATAELAKASLGDGMRVVAAGGERVCDAGEVVEQRGFAPFLPAVARLAVASDGKVWAQRFEADEEAGRSARIDLFDAEGTYLGGLPEGTPFPVGFLPDGRILTSEQDELDVQRLVVRTFEITGAGGT